MSGSNIKAQPTYTISVGTPGTFTNDSAIDVSAEINAEIQAAPQGESIKVFFNPGIYGDANSVRIPSDTSVIGNNATLVALATFGSSPNIGLLTNADSYFQGTTTVVNNSTGLPTYINNWTNVETISGDSDTAIKDTNISVQGMTFLINDTWVFGTWFTNATNVDIQNNVYIGGVDGNAFVNVVNGIVANNIAIGQYNSAYDNWNGPTNITIEDNQTFMSGTSNSGWSVLVNSTPTGDANNPGNANNVGIVDNLFSSNWINSASVNTDALLSYGFTAESKITQQGNLTTSMNIPNAGQFYSASPASNFTIEDNLFSQLVQSSGDSYYAIGILSRTTAQPDVTANAVIEGNLIAGVASDGSTSIIENDGDNPITLNNAILGDNNSNPISNSSFDGNGFSAGNIVSGSGQTTGSGVTPYLDISAPPTLSPPVATSIPISGLAILDPLTNDILSVTLVTQFGSISTTNNVTDSIIGPIGGETTIVLNGNLSAINSDLGQLSYTSNNAGWDDSIEVSVTTSSGLIATKYIPILIETSSINSGQPTTLYPGEITAWQTNTHVSAQTLAATANLSGDTVIAASGNNNITMGSTINVAFIGSGDNTIQGGPNDEYIALGSGNESINLFNNGDITVAGGSGSMLVNAATGNNLIETGAGTSSINAGTGINTILGGLGSFTVSGGSGSLTLETLPQDGGNMSAFLGTGNGTIFALSGKDRIETKSNTSNLIYLGIGSNQLFSAGSDSIYTGAGSNTIDASAGGADTIVGGSGSLYFIGGSGSAVIASANNSTLLAGSGNLNIINGKNYTIQLNLLNGSTREISLGALPDTFFLNGYGSDPILSEGIEKDTLAISLSDGTRIYMPDPSYEAVSASDGRLAFISGTNIQGHIYFDIDNVSGINQNNGSQNGQIIGGLISSAPLGSEIMLFSTGLINNGVISL